MLTLFDSYHNTNGEKGTTLQASEAKAKGQEELVLEYFNQLPNMQLSAEMVYNGLIARGLIDNRVPLTSCRRAVTNLFKQRKLIKTDTKVIGSYGKEIYLYKLANQNT